MSVGAVIPGSWAVRSGRMASPRSVPTTARAGVLADLDRVILRPLTADAGFGAGPGTRLFPRDLAHADREALRAAVEARPGSWAAEEYSEASTAPAVHDGRLAAGRLVLRGFVVAHGDDWDAARLRLATLIYRARA